MRKEEKTEEVAVLVSFPLTGATYHLMQFTSLIWSWVLGDLLHSKLVQGISIIVEQHNREKLLTSQLLESREGREEPGREIQSKCTAPVTYLFQEVSPPNVTFGYELHWWVQCPHDPSIFPKLHLWTQETLGLHSRSRT